MTWEKFALDIEPMKIVLRVINCWPVPTHEQAKVQESKELRNKISEITKKIVEILEKNFKTLKESELEYDDEKIKSFERIIEDSKAVYFQEYISQALDAKQEYQEYIDNFISDKTNNTVKTELSKIIDSTINKFIEENVELSKYNLSEIFWMIFDHVNWINFKQEFTDLNLIQSERLKEEFKIASKKQGVKYNLSTLSFLKILDNLGIKNESLEIYLEQLEKEPKEPKEPKEQLKMKILVIKNLLLKIEETKVIEQETPNDSYILQANAEKLTEDMPNWYVASRKHNPNLS